MKWLGATLLLAIFGGGPGLEVPIPELGGAEDDVVRAVHEAAERVRDEPRSAESWAALGDRYTAHRWHAEAARCYARAERIQPDEFLWPYLRGRALPELWT